MPFVSIVAICIGRERGSDLYRVSQRGRGAARVLLLWIQGLFTRDLLAP